jgi:cephalosporin-C deacetylase-like acetyl esterase
MLRVRRFFMWPAFAALAAGAALTASIAAQQPAGPPSPAEQARRQERAAAQSAEAQAGLIAFLNPIGFGQAKARAAQVAALRTKDDAIARQAEVRRRIASLVGGIPKASGRVVPKIFGRVDDDGFRIENVAFESVPGYWITANVFVPAGTGPFPALVVAPGHGAGKQSQYSWAANFARAGILVLSIDPMGQGERMQHYDSELGASKLEPSGEHEHANQTALLVGQHIARYWFADGVRSVDYLTARPDVDASRIGTFGCSGGGTAAAYLAAMDPRVRVAAIASFITSFTALLPGNGPQDAEQTLPRFLASGLDFADWVELAAPRPVAIVGFENDFFPIAGVKETYEEARRIYALHGAADRLQLIHGQGGHCNLGPVMPQVLGFLGAHLKGPDAPVPAFAPLRPTDPDALVVTPSGQVSTSLAGSLTVEEMVRRDSRTALAAATPVASAEALAALRARVIRDVRSLTAAAAQPGAVPAATSTPRPRSDGGRGERVMIESEPGVTLEGIVVAPEAPGPATHPAVLWMDAAPVDDLAGSPEVARLVKAGRLVLLLHPRGVLGEPPPNPNQLALGPYMPLLLRAVVVGRTLVGLRVDDTIRAIDWLASRPDVDPAAITVYGTGAQGLVALHAAALDPRIAHVVAERSLVSYRTALEAGLHRNLSEVLIPDVLRHYDTPDLVAAIHPRPVTLINPVNAMGQPMRASLARAAMASALESDRRLKTPDRVRLVRRGPGDPLPIP